MVCGLIIETFETSHCQGYTGMDQGPQSLCVFIAHSSLDTDLFIMVRDALKENGIRTFSYEEDILAGQAVAGSVSQGIQNCDRFLMLMTEHSHDSGWCTLEIILALEKAQFSNIASAMFLIDGVHQDQCYRTNRKWMVLYTAIILALQKARFSDIASAMFLINGVLRDQLPEVALFNEMDQIVMQFDDDKKWNPCQIQEVLRKLKETKTINSVLPAGNVAHGQAWSHFCGFHEIVLPRLKDKVMEYKENTGSHINMPTKVYELIPESCHVPSNIASIDGRVKMAGKLPVIEVVRGGNPRKYEPIVYKIKDDEDDKEYYCIAEYPSTLGGIKDMESSKMAKVTKHDRRLQLARYFYTLNSIINHPKLKCQNRARLLPFNDSKVKPSTVLLEAIKNDLQFEKDDSAQQERKSGETTLRHPLAIDRLDSCLPEVQEYDATIIYSTDTEITEDRNIAETITHNLERNGVNFFDIESIAGRRELNILEMAVQKCRWLIVILSKSSLMDKNFYLKIINMFTRSVDDKKVRVIPCLVDVVYNEIPEFLRWIVYIDVKDKNYLERLCCAVKGDDIPMFLDTHIPAGNVAHGLAWAYYINFLRFILPDCVRQIKDYFKALNVTDYTCPEKLYILIPESCDCSGKLPDKHHSITIPFKETLCVTKEHAGTKRSYNLPVHKVIKPTVDSEDYYFVGLYAAPILTLHQMLGFGIAGINESTMKQEAHNFIEILQNIITKQTQDVVQYCKILHFDDSHPGNLAEMMIKQIKLDSSDADDCSQNNQETSFNLTWFGIGGIAITGLVLALMAYKRLT